MLAKNEGPESREATLKRSNARTGRPGVSSGDRMLAVLDLFAVENPEWTVEAAAEALQVSAPTAYRYFKQLTKAGLLSPVSGASYALGPAIIQMDHQIQICDPMLNAARSVMVDLIQYAAESATVLLCRLYHDRVMCVHQVVGRGPQLPVSYERGRLMPLFRGATSKIILAHLPARTLRSLFDHHADEIAAAGLGTTSVAFRRYLAGLRRAGAVVSRGEIDPGRVGVAAPIFGAERAILGSLSFVLPEPRADDRLIARLTPLTVAGAREIEQAMVSIATTASSPARVKLAR
jgi:DNA-binding IclR family transcriptional regulator